MKKGSQVASDDKSSVRGCNEILEGVENFYHDLAMWGDFCRFYERYPNHPCRWIHERTKVKLDEIWRMDV